MSDSRTKYFRFNTLASQRPWTLPFELVISRAVKVAGVSRHGFFIPPIKLGYFWLNRILANHSERERIAVSYLAMPRQSRSSGRYSLANHSEVVIAGASPRNRSSASYPPDFWKSPITRCCLIGC